MMAPGIAEGDRPHVVEPSFRGTEARTRVTRTEWGSGYISQAMSPSAMACVSQLERYEGRRPNGRAAIRAERDT